MGKYRKQALVLSISFILLFSISLFLSSCGSNTPITAAPKALQTSASQSSQALISVSNTPTGITISIASATNTSYNVYMSEIPSISSTSYIEIIPNNGVYPAPLNPNKTYSFLITSSTSNQYKSNSNMYNKIIGTVISKPGINNTTRTNTAFVLPAQQQTPSPVTNAPNAFAGIAYECTFLYGGPFGIPITCPCGNPDIAYDKQTCGTVFYKITYQVSYAYKPAGTVTEYITYRDSHTGNYENDWWWKWDGDVTSAAWSEIMTGIEISETPPCSSKITIYPPTATIYIHHSDPTKKQQQFQASDGSQNITQQATWSTSDTNIANISNFDIHKGLAFAGSQPGTVKINATDTSGTKADLPAELNVECREYAKHKQDEGIWRNKPLGHYSQVVKRSDPKLPDPPFAPLNSIGAWGCALTVIADIVEKTPLDVNSILLNSATPPEAQFSGTAQIDWTTTVDYLSSDTITYETGNIPAINNSGFIDQDPYNIGTIDAYLSLCKTVVVGIHGGPYPPNINSYPHHYMIVLGKNPDGTYKVFDPAVLSSIQTLPANQQIYAHMVYNHN